MTHVLVKTSQSLIFAFMILGPQGECPICQVVKLPVPLFPQKTFPVFLDTEIPPSELCQKE